MLGDEDWSFKARYLDAITYISGLDEGTCNWNLRQDDPAAADRLLDSFVQLRVRPGAVRGRSTEYSRRDACPVGAVRSAGWIFGRPRHSRYARWVSKGPPNSLFSSGFPSSSDSKTASTASVD
jgi:hypothetical protein